MSAPSGVWAVVLIKDFDSAKQRLSPALDVAARAALAHRNAGLALKAARAADHVLVVAGGEQPAELARRAGVEVLLETDPRGQNPAADRGISHAVERGAAAVLLLSSDLPLVNREAVAGLLRHAQRLGEPAVLAAPATGRGGTNALFLRPPRVIGLHFGDGSLGKFERDARSRGVPFELHETPRLALDLDEPEDLAELARTVRG